MKPIYSVRCLYHFVFSSYFLLNVVFLMGFSGPFEAILRNKSYSVAALPIGMRMMEWPHRKQKLQQLNTFRVRGHIEIRSHNHGGIDLPFKWEQNAKDYSFTLLDSKHHVFLEMNADANQAKLRAKNKTYFGHNAELLLTKYLKVPIPLSYLKDWLRGIPSPNLCNERVFNPTKHLLTLKQANWFIRYLRYNTVGAIDLPTQLFMMKQDWHMRILITHWGV